MLHAFPLFPTHSLVIVVYRITLTIHIRSQTDEMQCNDVTGTRIRLDWIQLYCHYMSEVQGSEMQLI